MSVVTRSQFVTRATSSRSWGCLCTKHERDERIHYFAWVFDVPPTCDVETGKFGEYSLSIWQSCLISKTSIDKWRFPKLLLLCSTRYLSDIILHHLLSLANSCQWKAWRFIELQSIKRAQYSPSVVHTFLGIKSTNY